MTTWTVTITVGPAESDDGFVEYLLGEIDNAIESTDVEGLDVVISVQANDTTQMWTGSTGDEDAWRRQS